MHEYIRHHNASVHRMIALFKIAQLHGTRVGFIAGTLAVSDRAERGGR